MSAHQSANVGASIKLVQVYTLLLFPSTMDLAILVSTDIQVLTDTIKMLSNSPISTAQCELIYMSRLHENDFRTRCLVADDPPVDDICS
jgi:hypothetical protein